MPTIKDVAREAGVSIATVSYVLNNKGGSISEPTRALVLETARKIGYTPNITARNLRFSRTGLIGYAWHEVPIDVMNPVLDQFIYHLAHAAEAVGYHLLTFTHPPEAPEPVYDELIRTRRLDAFVLAGTQTDDPRIRLLLERQFPFVAFGRSDLSDTFAYVDVHAEQGVHDAISYLVELGHRRIAMIAWQDNASTSVIRLRAYQQTMQHYGLSIPPEMIFYGVHAEDTGRRALAHWQGLAADQRPTAIFAISDLEAIGLMHAAQSYEIQIGRDLSLIGFDDTPMSQHLMPALTTIRQPIPLVAQSLVEMVESLLNMPDTLPEPLLLPPELIIRDSCQPIT